MNKFKILFIITFFQLFVGCKNNQKETQNPDVVKSNVLNKSDIVSYQFIFPDTVYLDISYNGTIKYNGILDTITTKLKFDMSSKSRYILFAVLMTEKLAENNQELENKKLDTIDATDAHNIQLSKIKFKKLGTFYIDGIIKDEAFISLNKKDKNGETLYRKITNECRATHKVTVIKKPN
ncbi:MAG: hypothetical protein ACOH1O_02700 [Flavobacterium sp.]